MRRFVTLLSACGLLAAVLAPAAATAGGGPMPGVLHGWDGIGAGAVRYVTLPARGSTVLASVRARDGRITRYGWLRGGWGIPLVTWQGDTDGLSRDGRALVLSQTGVGYREVTRFAIVDLRKFRIAQTIALKGTFAFDAMSPDGKTLFLTQYLSRQDAQRYAVRAYDLERRRLYAKPVIARDDPNEKMSGSPTRRVVSPSGRWVYTMYVGGPEPFVHALDTQRRDSLCLDIPWQGKQDALWRMRMSLTPDGSKLVLRGANRRIVLATRA